MSKFRTAAALTAATIALSGFAVTAAPSAAAAEASATVQGYRNPWPCKWFNYSPMCHV